MGAATEAVLAAVREERLWQETLKAAGRFKHTCADAEMSDTACLAVLVEEVGECARAVLESVALVNDKNGAQLYKELIQVAAVAVAWAERLGNQGAVR